jgi:hypothetical protein
MRNALILASLFLASACNFSMAQEAETAGESIRRNYQVAAFDRVSMAGPHDVIVTVGGAPSVRAEGDSKLIEELEVKVEDGRLYIGPKNRKGNWSSNRKALTVYVSAPSLSAAELAGSGDLKIDKVEGKSFSAAIAGSGDIELASLRVEQASFSIGGSGNIKASGAALGSDVSIAGSGDLDLAGLDSRRSKVAVVGSGNVSARATEAADVSIMGSGDVTISGGGKCNVSKMGSGAVRCAG